MPSRNEPDPRLPEEAFFLFRELLQGGVLVFRPKYKSDHKLVGSAEEKPSPSEAAEIIGVSVNRKVYGNDAFYELLLRGIVDEEGNLVPDMRERYAGLAQAPSLKRVFKGKKRIRDMRYTFLNAIVGPSDDALQPT